MDDKVGDKEFNIIFNNCISNLNVQKNGKLQFVKFENGKIECLGIQFVDMIIYVLYRFLLGKDVMGIGENMDSLLMYYSTILHKIRHTFLKNHYFGKSQTGFSSCVLLSDYKDYNFAVNLEREIVKIAYGEKTLRNLLR